MNRPDAPVRATPRPATLIPAADWRPIDIDDLEPAAWQALRHPANTAVVAGPGAGKTEFLAQRAAYLLQTGICPWPQRILAISFKRDAAANLGRRVTTRIPEHADRFVSMTFDAFTKSLVDRFASALPPDWRMTDGYEIDYVSERFLEGFLADIIPAAPASLYPQVAALRASRFLPDTIGNWSLPATIPADDPDDATAYAALQWWHDRYLRPGPAKVDFIMLNRLAELLVRCVPQLRRALRQTYPFVFVDEFQDTTSAQFSFLASVFADGPTLTAVGDSKQRIMGWAGALPRALERFAEAFDAASYPLLWNFRSSDELVRVQHIVATSLDPAAMPAVSKADGSITDSPAEVWRFSSPNREATVIADWIARDIAVSGRVPADFALIARQKISDFENRFRQSLGRYDIKVRNDDMPVGAMRLQDLLKHEVTRLLLGLLRLADQPRGLARVWKEVQATLARVHGDVGDDAGQRRTADHLSTLTISLRDWLKNTPPGASSAVDCVNYLLELLGVDLLHRYIRSAAPADRLNVLTEAFQARLAAVAPTSTDWADALGQFECADAVVLLTAHRSKGLEYHTVFFLGLEDRQWWAHARDPIESTSTFFVGLSRAAQRIIFTTTHPYARQGQIADFFTMLDEAGVPEIDHG
ncbi:ATP-dependent helicase [Actinoplanes sp. NPDC023936]|uniref:ATP-dependent helicase n=1 Tax=Actinoplanes sp. NPDC023936 TaxID=3154910 RepID=UPI0033C590F4